MLVSPVDWSETVDDVSIGKAVCTSDHRLTRVDRCQCPALFLQTRSSGAVYGSRYSPTASQPGIGGVNDDVYVGLIRNIPPNTFDRDVVERSLGDKATSLSYSIVNLGTPLNPTTCHGQKLSHEKRVSGFRMCV